MGIDEKDVFLAALALPDAEEREAYLQAAYAGHPELLGRLRELLSAHDESQGPLDRRPAALGVTVDAAHAEGPDSVIGAYQLLQQIGEGGMGTVWMAQQTEPIKRLVAVKLIKAGMDSRQVIARFEAERQALALMDHAHIARVLDAGTTGAGRPYFVMDLVKGVPITRYSDEHRLTPRQRLELFIPICEAVQHAHQKGIIHRDLKPSNVLVALSDGKPVPKVIDFGVAKAAGQPLTDKTLVTGFGAIVGTPEYMSPEQAEINQLDIDTRSDIYSLGVLLYELLTGSPPFTRQELDKGGLLEMLRVIREQEPPRPSTKLSTAEGLPTLAANRGTEPAKLTKLVRGELDWIVLKALEKDRNRRYETANGLAMDIQRYLADEPVLACPPSAGYRLKKFVRRNKRTLITAALLGAMLLVVAGIVGWTARDRAARRSRNAEAVAALLGQCEAALRADQADQAGIALEAAERRAGDGGAKELAGRLARCRADLGLLRKLDATDTFRRTWAGSAFPGPKVVATRWRAALADYGVTPDGGRAASSGGTAEWGVAARPQQRLRPAVAVSSAGLRQEGRHKAGPEGSLRGPQLTQQGAHVGPEGQPGAALVLGKAGQALRLPDPGQVIAGLPLFQLSPEGRRSLHAVSGQSPPVGVQVGLQPGPGPLAEPGGLLHGNVRRVLAAAGGCQGCRAGCAVAVRCRQRRLVGESPVIEPGGGRSASSRPSSSFRIAILLSNSFRIGVSASAVRSRARCRATWAAWIRCFQLAGLFSKVRTPPGCANWARS
jgi:serine/threonine protein kinase